MNTPGPTAAQVLAALEATWPAASSLRQGGWLLRDGAGGGKRVSAARALDPAAEIGLAEDAMRAAGARPLFQVTEGQEALDARLAQRGYRKIDPTLLYCAGLPALAQKAPPVRLFDIWPPLAIMCEIWADGGITPARLAVMARAPEPRTALLARIEDRASGVAFVACHDGIAMIHAIEVAPRARRKGVARLMLQGAAHWAKAQGAGWMALAVTEANEGARALYAAAGMAPVGRYHYREKD